MSKVNIIGSIYLGCVIIILAVMAWRHPFTNEIISTNGCRHTSKR